MVELVDTPDLGSGAAMRVGSSPIRRTRETSLVESPFFVRRFQLTFGFCEKWGVYYWKNGQKCCNLCWKNGQNYVTLRWKNGQTDDKTQDN